MTQKTTGGGFFGDQAIPKEYVNNVVQVLRHVLPRGVTLITDIGSAGYKPYSHDIDLFIDADSLMEVFGVSTEKLARHALQTFMQDNGYHTRLAGRNVHVEVPYESDTASHTVQVDLMVIVNAKLVAEWHQHGLRGMYSSKSFKAGHIFILMSSIAKHVGMKFDAFAGALVCRNSGAVIARTRDDVAKVLLNPLANGNDLNSVDRIICALRNDPAADAKLAQARQDAAKGIIVLPERTYA